LPSIDDYWAMETRVPQVANLMSNLKSRISFGINKVIFYSILSNRFRLMKRLVHFNDNTQIPDTIDRFFKIWPLFNHLNTAFRSDPQTPKQ